MALVAHSGSNSTDLGQYGTKRDDISDYLLASLVPENNVLGLVEIGPEVVDTAFRWVEDRLNNNFITDLTGGGQSAGSVTLNVSAADAAIVDVGWVLSDEGATNGIVTGEQVEITAKSGTALTITRSYGGTTPSTHAQNAIWRVISSPTFENSDLGPDMSRARLLKNNVITRFEINVNISQEQIERALAGAAPGIPDELEYQFEQRVREMLRRQQQTLLYSRAATGVLAGTPSGISGGDYSTTAGLTSWLDGTVNSTAAPAAQAGAIFSDAMLNTYNKTLFRNGAVADWIVVGVNGAEKLGQLYNDRIRLEQNDRGRGFFAKYFDTTIGNTLRIVADAFVYDTSPNGVVYLVDSGRIRIRPFVNSFFYLIQAPSFRDGDAVRALSKWGLEVRNTGTDVGAAHQLLTGVGF